MKKSCSSDIEGLIITNISAKSNSVPMDIDTTRNRNLNKYGRQQAGRQAGRLILSDDSDLSADVQQTGAITAVAPYCLRCTVSRQRRKN